MFAGKLSEILEWDGGEFDFDFNQKHHNSLFTLNISYLALFVPNLCWGMMLLMFNFKCISSSRPRKVLGRQLGNLKPSLCKTA